MDISSHISFGNSPQLSRSFGAYSAQGGESVQNTGQPVEKQSTRDKVSISQTGQELSSSRSSSADGNPPHYSVETNDEESLDSQEIQQLVELKSRDTEVRIHEQAHLSAAGQYARGGPSFTYQQGPDGVRYAVGGEVGIDVSKENTPEATIAKMQTIKRAALAPASPSGADKSIAAKASQLEIQARQEALVKQQQELLHTEKVENPNVRQEETGDNPKSRNKNASLSYGKLQMATAAYQRVASY